MVGVHADAVHEDEQRRPRPVDPGGFRQQAEERATAGTGNVHRVADDQPRNDFSAPAILAVHVLGVRAGREGESGQQKGERGADHRGGVSEERKAMVLAFAGKRPILSA